MSTVSTDFTSVTTGSTLSVDPEKPRKAVTYAVTGTFVGTVQIERKIHTLYRTAVWVPIPGLKFNAVASGKVPVPGRVTFGETIPVRANCVAYTSGTLTCAITN